MIEIENYFFDTGEKCEKGLRFYVLVIYDIMDNKRRVKLAKLMKSYGFRVQKSAFEARLSEGKLNKLLSHLPHYVADNGSDSIRIYKLRGNGVVTVIGKDEAVAEDEVIII